MLLVAVISVPIVSPIGLPVPISRYTKMAYDAIEAVPQNSLVLFSSVNAGGNWPDLGIPSVALTTHLFKRHLKFVFIGFDAGGEAPTVQQTMILPAVDRGLGRFGAQYGVDYVNLGWVAGLESGEAAFANNIRSVVTRDFVQGKPIDELPIMKGVNTGKDFQFVIHVGYAEDPIRQYVTAFKLPLVVATWGMMGPHYPPYVEAGQMKGLIVGMPGAAEYELLIGMKGDGLRGSDALSMTHLMVAVFCVLGNVYYFGVVRRGRKAKEE